MRKMKKRIVILEVARAIAEFKRNFLFWFVSEPGIFKSSKKVKIIVDASPLNGSQPCRKYVQTCWTEIFVSFFLFLVSLKSIFSVSVGYDNACVGISKVETC